jgi:glutathione S-transferase
MKAESIRLACAYSKIPLEDVRITSEDFAQLKAVGKLAFGQVPALEVDDKQVIIQSASIMRLFHSMQLQ